MACIYDLELYIQAKGAIVRYSDSRYTRPQRALRRVRLDRMHMTAVKNLFVKSICLMSEGIRDVG